MENFGYSGNEGSANCYGNVQNKHNKVLLKNWVIYLRLTVEEEVEDCFWKEMSILIHFKKWAPQIKLSIE